MTILALVRAELTRVRGLKFTVVLLVIQSLLLALSLLGNGSLLLEEVEAGVVSPADAAVPLLDLAFIATMFASIAGAVQLTGSLRSGTFGALTIVQPRRHRMLTATSLVAGGIGVLYAVAATIVAVAGVHIALGRAGLDVALSASYIARLSVGLAAASFVAGVVGAAVGAAIRHQAAAVGALVLWIVAVEVPITLIAPSLGELLPGQLYGALLGSSTPQSLSLPIAILVLVAWVLAAFAAGAQRLDHYTL